MAAVNGLFFGPGDNCTGRHGDELDWASDGSPAGPSSFPFIVWLRYIENDVGLEIMSLKLEIMSLGYRSRVEQIIF